MKTIVVLNFANGEVDMYSITNKEYKNLDSVLPERIAELYNHSSIEWMSTSNPVTINHEDVTIKFRYDTHYRDGYEVPESSLSPKGKSDIGEIRFSGIYIPYVPSKDEMIAMEEEKHRPWYRKVWRILKKLFK